MKIIIAASDCSKFQLYLINTDTDTDYVLVYRLLSLSTKLKPNHLKGQGSGISDTWLL